MRVDREDGLVSSRAVCQLGKPSNAGFSKRRLTSSWSAPREPRKGRLILPPRSSRLSAQLLRDSPACIRAASAPASLSAALLRPEVDTHDHRLVQLMHFRVPEC